MRCLTSKEPPIVMGRLVMAHLRRKTGLTLIALGVLLATLAAPTSTVGAANTNYYKA
jgi:hypothetical protein